MSKANQIANFMGVLKKTHGERSVGSASYLGRKKYFLSTGSFLLDLNLGGGIRVGRPVMMYGDESCGKTTTALRTAGVSQKLCALCLRRVKDLVVVPPPPEILVENPEARWSQEGSCDCVAKGLNKFPVFEPPREKEEKAKDYKERIMEWREVLQTNSYDEFVVAWIDPEGALENDWAEKLGVNPKLLLYACTGTGEEAVDMTRDIIASTLCNLVVIDSLAHLTPQEEYIGSAVDWQRALQARITNKGIRTFITGQNMAHKKGKAVTQIWINQTRTNMNVRWGDKKVKPGGTGQDFAMHVSVNFWRGAVETTSQIYGSKEEKIDIPLKETFYYTVKKCKSSGCKSVNGNYTQAMRGMSDFSEGTVLEDELLFKLAMKYLIEKKSNIYYLGDQEFNTQRDLREKVETDSEFREFIKMAIMGVMGVDDDS